MDVTPGLRREPGPDLEAVGQDDELAARIHAEIERDGPITFARFMELALYDPAGGYYRAATARPGRDGDFLTAPETHPIFGATLARAVIEAWERLGRPDPFVLREFGAGTGTLALAVLAGIDQAGSALAGRLRYDPVEVEPHRLETIAARFRDGRAVRDPPRTATLRPDRSTASSFANEVLDALPAHRVVGRDGSLREILVGSHDGRLRRRGSRAIHGGVGGSPGGGGDRPRGWPAWRDLPGGGRLDRRRRPAGWIGACSC